jgi:hypothetical protein
MKRFGVLNIALCRCLLFGHVALFIIQPCQDIIQVAGFDPYLCLWDVALRSHPSAICTKCHQCQGWTKPINQSVSVQGRETCTGCFVLTPEVALSRKFLWFIDKRHCLIWCHSLPSVRLPLMLKWRLKTGAWSRQLDHDLPYFDVLIGVAKSAAVLFVMQPSCPVEHTIDQY